METRRGIRCNMATFTSVSSQLMMCPALSVGSSLKDAVKMTMGPPMGSFMNTERHKRDARSVHARDGIHTRQPCHSTDSNATVVDDASLWGSDGIADVVAQHTTLANVPA